MSFDGSAFQSFLRHYFMADEGGIQFQKRLNRFALSVEIVTKFCPVNGYWFDAGTMGHDAIRVKIIRPDIIQKLAVFEGCIIYIGNEGLHYYEGSDNPPKNHVYCQKVDIEHDNLPYPDRFFDLVTSFEVIEHFKYGPQKTLKEVNRVLKNDGFLILTTPNINCATSIHKILTGSHPAESGQYHRDPEYGRIHPLEYSMRQLHDLITAYGFRIDILSTINLTAFSKEERIAIEVAQSYANRQGMRIMQEFGEKLVLIARKVRNIDRFEYPAEVYE